MNKNIILTALSVFAFLSLFLPWKDHPLLSISGWEWQAWWVLLPWMGVVTSTLLKDTAAQALRAIGGVGLIIVGGFCLLVAFSLKDAGAGSGLILFITLSIAGIIFCFVNKE